FSLDLSSNLYRAFFFTSRRRHTRSKRDWSSDVCSSDLLGEQERAEEDEAHAVEIATVDYLAQVSMLTVLSDAMATGYIIAFSSIAGWRARRANYVYGSTKAGLDRSEEHTSELQSRFDLVCRLLLEKKKTNEHVSADSY